jgi:hypothetical protein
MSDDPRRSKIISIASVETSLGVEASKSDGLPPDSKGRRRRQGWERLQTYFTLAAPGQFSNDVVVYTGPISDWCGIFALWATKTAGLDVGTWKRGQGIASVDGFKRVASPKQGDICYKEYVNGRKTQHMNLAASVDSSKKTVSTIDGNDSGGTITGPSKEKSWSEFDAFYSAFAETPVGRWYVREGVWTWNYVFYSNGTCDWRDIVHPNVIRGAGTWKMDDLLRIAWATGTREHWDLPLDPVAQTGTLVGQGKIVSAKRL